MAKAPRPGTTSSSTSQAGGGDRAQVMEITVRGEPVTLSMGMLGPRDDALVRRATLKTLGYKASLLGAINEMNDEDTVGLDTVALLWWLARRKAGETELTLAEALDAFPSYGDMEADESVVDFRITEPDSDGDTEDASPEG